jgi:hypothetical protein
MPTESPGRWPYGPSTPAVRRFLQRFAALDPAAWDAAAAAFHAAERTPAFATADQALALAIERSGRVAERDAVLGPLLQLVRPAGGEAGGEHPVAAAALGAVLALVVHDVMDEGAFRALYAPFATLIPVDHLLTP